MKSLTDQRKEVLQAEQKALAEHETITSDIWEAQRHVAELLIKQRQAYARYKQCLDERRRLDQALARERQFQNGSGR